MPEPHYHFQMRVSKQAFIRYNDFHVPFLDRDISMIEAARIAPETVRPSFAGAPGMSEVLRDDMLEQIVMGGMSGDGGEQAAPIGLSTIIVADEGTKISGDALAKIFEEAKRTRVSVTSLAHRLPNVNVRTIVSPGPGVVELAPRSGRKK